VQFRIWDFGFEGECFASSANPKFEITFTRPRLAAKRHIAHCCPHAQEIDRLEPERNVPIADRGAKHSSLGDVARRISSRTTDLVAISIVLVASLTLGRQILHWWHAEPSSPTAAVGPDLAGPAWDDETQPVSLEFGDLPMALTRQLVKGDQQVAIEALVRHCRGVAESAACPAREPDDAERRLLEKLSGLTPVEGSAEKSDADSVAEKPGDWQVYIVDERFTMVAAVRRFPDHGAGVWPADGQAGRLHHNDAEGQERRLHHKPALPDGQKETARGGARLVCWGMAMPVGERAWTLYLFRESSTGSPSPSGLPNVPLPPGANRNLSVRDERGGLVLGFYGSGSAPNWMKFYDDWFARQGWSKTDKWSTGAEAWSARFTPQQVSQAGSVEIRFAADHDGEMTGLLQIQ
jgi:hypothetical protein